MLSCKNNSNDPVATIELFMKSLDKADFKTAREFVTEEYSYKLKSIENSGVKSRIEKVDYYYKLLEKKDSTAQVFVSVPQEVTNYTLTFEFSLVKRNGKWLILDQYSE